MEPAAENCCSTAPGTKITSRQDAKNAKETPPPIIPSFQYSNPPCPRPEGPMPDQTPAAGRNWEPRTDHRELRIYRLATRLRP